MKENDKSKIIKDLWEVDKQVVVLESEKSFGLMDIPLKDVGKIVETTRDINYLEGMRSGLKIAQQIVYANFKNCTICLPPGDKEELTLPRGGERIEVRKLDENGPHFFDGVEK